MLTAQVLPFSHSSDLTHSILTAKQFYSNFFKNKFSDSFLNFKDDLSMKLPCKIHILPDRKNNQSNTLDYKKCINHSDNQSIKLINLVAKKWPCRMEWVNWVREPSLLDCLSPVSIQHMMQSSTYSVHQSLPIFHLESTLINVHAKI